jgi:hypothetical protein
MPGRGHGPGPAPGRPARCDARRLPSGIEHPRPCGVGPCQAQDVFPRRMASPPWATPGAASRAPRFPAWCQGVCPQGWDTAIDEGRQAQWAGSWPLGERAPTNRVDRMTGEWATLRTSPPLSFPSCLTTLPPRLHRRSTRLQRFLASSAGGVPDGRCALTAGWRPRRDPRRPGRLDTGVQCSPGLRAPPCRCGHLPSATSCRTSGLQTVRDGLASHGDIVLRVSRHRDPWEAFPRSTSS